MRFLSPEWTQAVTSRIVEDDLVDELPDRSCLLQLNITSAPPLTLNVGVEKVVLSPGEATSPDASLSYTYETAVRMAQRELMPGEAFRAGLITATGDVDVLMGLEEVFDDVVCAMNKVECEY
ncbi:SCP2 sterol-binding domain-containing protein [Lentzea sp. NPDC004782]|uniref:SCP2 sterol-binding domain-containing protein n=1 Tax=Lentzea sp. NPDC004782 TaxID=3154458 RepID=UPI0033A7135C